MTVLRGTHNGGVGDNTVIKLSLATSVVSRYTVVHDEQQG